MEVCTVSKVMHNRDHKTVFDGDHLFTCGAIFWLPHLTFVGPKVWFSTPDDIKSSTTFTFKWKLKKHPLHEKDTQI